MSISLAHAAEGSFTDAKSFNPDRFVGNPPDTHAWIPFGGRVRRCIGAAFANMEMTVTLRTLLREFEFGTTYAPTSPRAPAVSPPHPAEAGGRSCTGAQHECWAR